MTTDPGWLAAWGEDTTPTPDFVIRYAARAFGVSREALISPDRTHPLVHYRQVAMAAVIELTGESLPRVGRRFGGRDHRTVSHARDRVPTVPRLAQAFEKLVAAARRQWAIDNGLPDPGQQTLDLSE